MGYRTGSFPAMPTTRTFRIVFVSQNHGASGALTESTDKTVQYSGKKIVVTP